MDKMALTRKEAADEIRVSLPKLDVYLKRQANPIPAIRCGRKLLIPKDGLREWLAAEAERGTNNGKAL